MGNERGTTIGIGKTDGFRYVAVMPPLSDEEFTAVFETGIADAALMVVTPPECTMFQLHERQFAGGNPDEVATTAANEVSKVLSQIRGEIKLQPEIVQLGYGSQTSPFNPETGE